MGVQLRPLVEITAYPGPTPDLENDSHAATGDMTSHVAIHPVIDRAIVLHTVDGQISFESMVHGILDDERERYSKRFRLSRATISPSGTARGF